MPASGLALDCFLGYGGANITPESSVGVPSILIGEESTTFQNETQGLALAKRDSIGTVSFDFVFGFFERGAILFKAAGT